MNARIPCQDLRKAFGSQAYRADRTLSFSQTHLRIGGAWVLFLVARYLIREYGGKNADFHNARWKN